ncbi:MAG: hypothetical protein AAGF75_09235 [Cyanobacteria bacterium P01_H01_bin.130]
MTELLITDLFPGATQDEDSITIPKADLHPSLGTSSDHKAEPIIAAMLWQLYQLALFPDSGFDVVSDQSISIVPDEDNIATDFDTETVYLFRQLRFRLREPYNPAVFSAANYA